MPQPFIELIDVNLSFKTKAGPLKILNDVNFQVMQGEAVALVGPSGSGKSSLLMLLGGLEQPSSGRIHILGKEITSLNQSAMTKFRRLRRMKNMTSQVRPQLSTSCEIAVLVDSWTLAVAAAAGSPASRPCY